MRFIISLQVYCGVEFVRCTHVPDLGVATDWRSSGRWRQLSLLILWRLNEELLIKIKPTIAQCNRKVWIIYWLRKVSIWLNVKHLYPTEWSVKADCLSSKHIHVKFVNASTHQLFSITEGASHAQHIPPTDGRLNRCPIQWNCAPLLMLSCLATPTSIKIPLRYDD